MKIPFTIDQFINTLQAYNETIWPLQLVFYILAIVCIVLLWEKKEYKNKVISGILSFFWLWMAVGLFVMAARSIPRYVLIIPFIWTLIGTSAAIFLGIKEDLGLLVSGVVLGVVGFGKKLK
jgi:hypothetical protein